MNIDKIFKINSNREPKMGNNRHSFGKGEFKEDVTASSALTLAGAVQGRKYKINRILGGRGLNSRLLSVGFLPGEVISIINQSGWGPLTVFVKGSKIALGRGIAHKIFVQELDLEKQ
jgi:ferrous iron transport protein A